MLRSQGFVKIKMCHFNKLGYDIVGARCSVPLPDGHKGTPASGKLQHPSIFLSFLQKRESGKWIPDIFLRKIPE